MKAPVFFFFFLAKVGEKQLSGEGGSLSRGKRSRTPAVFISCHWSATQLPCNSYTYCHFHVLKINTNARNWSQRSTFLVKMYFHPAILMRMDVCQGFRQCVGNGYAAHLSIPVCRYQYQLLFSVIGFPQRLSSLQPIPSQEMYWRMKLQGIKRLINCRDKSINNAEIGDTGTVSSSSKQLPRESPA